MKQTAIFFLAMLTIWVLVIIFLPKNAQKAGNDTINAPMGSGSSSFYHTIVIDSCEYIDAPNKLVHKGNCRFCAERHKSGHKEIVEHNNNDNYDKDSI